MAGRDASAAGVSERRANIIQRTAVVAVLAKTRGKTSLVRADDGAVYIYEKHCEATIRLRVAPNGAVSSPVVLY